MAAKTTTKSDPAFTTAIAQVQPALAAWRQRRKHREPIPETIWRRMACLARRYGLSPVAQALRVNYNGLKRHLVASPAWDVYGTGTMTPTFVEVPMSPGLSAPPWVIELEDGRGLKLTLRLAYSDSAAVLALAQGLWRHRS